MNEKAKININKKELVYVLFIAFNCFSLKKK